MSERNFEMRLFSEYGEKNSVTKVSAKILKQGKWEAFELSASSPGFLIFVYSLLGCQHLYFRTNCAERDLVLTSSEGSIKMTTSQSWDMQSLDVEFVGKLASGTPKDDDIDYITSRMKQCPVSKNVKEPQNNQTKVVFN